MADIFLGIIIIVVVLLFILVLVAQNESTNTKSNQVKVRPIKHTIIETNVDSKYH